MRNILGWFVHNRVASNLLMWSLIFGGLIALPQLHREEFPNIEVDVINVVAPYPGASPEEVELTVCSRVEEAVTGTPGIKKLTALAAENRCQVTIEVAEGTAKNLLLNEVKGKIDAIDTFPEEAENPVVSLVTILTNVIQMFIYGDTDEVSLKRLAEKVRLDLIDIPGISQVSVHYAKPYEISIEVSENTLRRYGTNLQSIARRVGANSLDLPAGSIDTADGQVLIRTVSQARNIEALENLVVITQQDGSNIRLKDIATVRDGFIKSDIKAAYNSQPALMVGVKRIGNEDVITVAETVKQYVEDIQYELPDGIEIAIWTDESQDLVDRLDALGTNGIGGLVLVLVVLAMFLKPHLAFWVAVGLPITLLGTLMTFPFFGITISTISVVGTLLVLGILVDAGVVVAERIHTNAEQGQKADQAAISGVHDVATPVIFGVLTSMVAFTPLIAMQSSLGSFFSYIGLTAIIALVFSLITSQLILPMQLSKSSMSVSEKSDSTFQRWQNRLIKLLSIAATDYYRPALHWCLNRRYLMIAFGIAWLIIMLGFLISGRIIFQFFPAIEGERLYASLSMPIGTDAATTERVTEQLVSAARQLEQQLEDEQSPIRITDSMVSIGIQLGRGSIGGTDESGGHQAEVALQLSVPPNHSGPGAKSIVNRWREISGTIPGVDKLTFTADAFTPGKAIEIELRGRDLAKLEQASAELRHQLSAYPGVFDIIDSFDGGKRELQLKLKDSARSLNINSEDLARQVRQSFYGEEVQRLQRGREDIKVMVRYPESERKSLSNIETMRIRTPEGKEVPFNVVADATMGRGMANIKRIDGLRVITVTADVDRNVITPEEVLTDLENTIMPALSAKYDSLINLAGEAEEKQSAVASLLISAGIAMFAIYTLLAIPLKSYLQPLIVMSVIPFGATGAIVGHVIMGVDLMFFSLLGIMALSGVAVNASLIMVDFYNRENIRLENSYKALVTAGLSRFRPLILTSATTFVGLIPLLVNQSISTMMFTPIAISLAFGVVTSAAMALLMVPCFCLVLEDIQHFLRGEPIASSQPVPHHNR